MHPGLVSTGLANGFFNSRFTDWAARTPLQGPVEGAVRLFGDVVGAGGCCDGAHEGPRMAWQASVGEGWAHCSAEGRSWYIRWATWWVRVFRNARSGLLYRAGACGGLEPVEGAVRQFGDVVAAGGCEVWRADLLGTG